MEVKYREEQVITSPSDYGEGVQRMQQEIRVPGEKEGRTLAAFL